MKKELDINKITFGIELEFTGISRKEALNCISKAVSGEVIREKTKTYILEGEREWKISKDSSILEEINPHIFAEEIISELSDRVLLEDFKKYIDDKLKLEYSSTQLEFVTPICTISDVNTIISIVEEFKKAGAVTNNYCGIHMHIGKKNMTYKTILHLIKTLSNLEPEIYELFDIYKNRLPYCRKIPNNLFEELEYLSKIKRLPYRESFERTLRNVDIWQKRENEIVERGGTKYFGLNLSNMFSLKTLEFRYFNATVDSNEILAIIFFVFYLISSSNELIEIDSFYNNFSLKSFIDNNLIKYTNGTLFDNVKEA